MIRCLDRKRKDRWKVQNIDFTHSSRKAWKTFNRISGQGPQPKQPLVTANSIAHQLITNGHFKGADKNQARQVKQQCSTLWNSAGADRYLCRPFSLSELQSALKLLKTGKAQGPNNIPLEFLKHCGQKGLDWLCRFYSTCIDSLAIPSIWHKATVIALLKPNKPANEAKSYRPISLLCIPFKLLERLLLARLEPVIDPQLPEQQTGFRRCRSTVK